MEGTKRVRVKKRCNHCGEIKEECKTQTICNACRCPNCRRLCVCCECRISHATYLHPDWVAFFQQQAPLIVAKNTRRCGPENPGYIDRNTDPEFSYFLGLCAEKAFSQIFTAANRTSGWEDIESRDRDDTDFLLHGKTINVKSCDTFKDSRKRNIIAPPGHYHTVDAFAGMQRIAYDRWVFRGFYASAWIGDHNENPPFPGAWMPLTELKEFDEL